MNNTSTPEKSIGLIAGAGELPAIVAMSATERGYRVVSIALQKDDLALLRPHSHSSYHFKIGQPNKIFKALKYEKIKDILIIGKIDKNVIFNRFGFDLRAIKLLAGMMDRNDTTLMKEVEKECKKEGLCIIDQASFIKELSTPEGVLSRRSPSDDEMDDLRFGYSLAKEMGRLDVGQTVVVRDKAIMAVEAIEGTDETIKRGCALARRGATIVKVSKPDQDLRMDIPVVGPQTIKNMVQGNAAALGLEAGKTLIINREETMRLADEAGIVVVGLSPAAMEEGKR